MIQLFKICFAEYGHLFRDKGVMSLFIGAILFYSFFYPYPYRSEVVKEIPIVVVDQDKSFLSRMLTRMAGAADAVTILSRAANFEEAKELVLQRKASGIILIPKDFQKHVLRGEKASVAAYSDATSFIVYKQVYTGIYSAVKTLSAGIEIKRLRASGMSSDQAADLREPLALNYVPLFNPAGGYASYAVPIVFVIILQQTFFIGICTMIGTMREKKNKSYFSPEHGSDNALVVIAGKAMAYFFIYFVHTIYCFGVMSRIYSFTQRGNIFDMVLFIIPFLLSVIFAGFTLASFFKQREMPVFFILSSSLPLMFISRLSWPVEMMPDYLQKLSLLIPSTAGVDGFIRIFTMGAGLKEVQTPFAILWVLTLVYFITAALSFRRIQRKKMD